MKKWIIYHVILRQTGILYGNLFDENAVISSFEIGDRYVYADPGVIPSLPTTADTNGQLFRIMHKCQNYHCARCNGLNHNSKTLKIVHRLQMIRVLSFF